MPARCYADNESRLEGLQGRFVVKEDGHEEAGYWNLSCPLEWSKYSCAHQNAKHANISRFVHYEAANCELPLFNPVVFANSLAGRRLIFLGDSLVRQVSISLSCMLLGTNLVERYEVGWPACEETSRRLTSKEHREQARYDKMSGTQGVTRKRRGTTPPTQAPSTNENKSPNRKRARRKQAWPCHGTVNCIPCGPHSGFNEYSLYLKNGGVIHTFVGEGFHFYGNDSRQAITYNSSDFVVLEGIHSEGRQRLWDNIRVYFSHQKELPHFIWLHGWPAFFQTRTGSYEPSVLQRLRTSGGKPSCRDRVPASTVRKQITEKVKNLTISSDASGQEVESLSSVHLNFSSGPYREDRQRIFTPPSGELKINRSFEGILWLEGEEEIGNYTVGQGVGAHGDCQHLCMPGPPDQIARALSWMLIAIGEEDEGAARAEGRPGAVSGEGASGNHTGGSFGGPEVAPGRLLRAQSTTYQYPYLPLVVILLMSMVALLSLRVLQRKY